VLYWIARFVLRCIAFHTLRIRRLGLDAARRPGGWLLACAHVSHLDPFCIGSQMPRRVGWMARIEFYRSNWARALLGAVHAFPVNRQGVPVSAIKTALQRLKAGEVVGVFPEGEIKTAHESVLRGAPIRRGVCLLAARANCPVLPCIILGTDKLNRVEPWLPARRGRLWVACGEFIDPVQGPDKHAARAEMAARLERAFVELYARLRREYGLDDSILP
jgi:1-acyl-sn-glycerol-3-phosphate acyltransferase